MEKALPGSLLPASRCAEVGIECFNICVPVNTEKFKMHDKVFSSEKMCMASCVGYTLGKMHFNA
jgi:hypothetical protein